MGGGGLGACTLGSLAGFGEIVGGRSGGEGIAVGIGTGSGIVGTIGSGTDGDGAVTLVGFAVARFRIWAIWI